MSSEIMLSFSSLFEKNKRAKREGKGKSLVSFPKDFVLVDIETTGLSPKYDFIIEIGAIRYINGVETESFTSLINPAYPDEPYIDDFIQELTGITPAMLSKAPNTYTVLEKFKKFIGDDIIVGYNVNFDINFLYDNFNTELEYVFENNFFDLLRISRKLFPELKSHSLGAMSSYFEISDNVIHRGLDDCRLEFEIFNRLKKEMHSKFECEEDFFKLFKKKHKKKLNAVDIVGDVNKINEDSPIFGKSCCFTGKLERFSRKDAMQLVADLGGFNENTVTKKTNFLIIGQYDYWVDLKQGKSSKRLKAEKNILEGQDLKIITEEVFYDMLGDEIN